MKERLDVLLVQQRPGRIKREGQGHHHGRQGLCGGTAGRQGRAPCLTRRRTSRCADIRCKYVSRGGLKLEKAMTHFDVTLEGKVCMDVGASTGGFTDCMLQNGAVKVYSVDVGSWAAGLEAPE